MKYFVIQTLEPKTNSNYYVSEWSVMLNDVVDVKLTDEINEAYVFDDYLDDPESAYPYIKEAILRKYGYDKTKVLLVERNTTIIEE